MRPKWPWFKNYVGLISSCAIQFFWNWVKKFWNYTFEFLNWPTYEFFSESLIYFPFISETLRKYPAAFAASRECSQNYVIPGTKICLPKGTNIKIPTWCIHRDRRYYTNPEKFDPKRFLCNNKHSIPNGTYLPFGDGPRSCVGKSAKNQPIMRQSIRFSLNSCIHTPYGSVRLTRGNHAPLAVDISFDMSHLINSLISKPKMRKS